MLLVILMLFMDCSSYQYFELDFNSLINLSTLIYVYFNIGNMASFHLRSH